MSSPAPSTSPAFSPFSAEWIASLTEKERAALAAALTPRLTKFIPYQPHPVQAAALLLDCEEVLFGGQAGGGKSDWLLMSALQYVDVPGYSALILRRSFQDIVQAGALIPRSKAWLFRWEGHGVSWNGQDHQWTFQTSEPGNPAVLKFGHAQHEDDVVRLYQGSEYHFVGFDEVTQFTEAMYEYLSTRMRQAEGSTIPIRMRATANPGGVGHEWVKARFIGEKDNPVRNPNRVFVPSKLSDNPSVAKNYAARLDRISDPVLRAQLRDGNWDMRPAGDMFKREWFQLVDEVPSGLTWVRYWDMAATAPSEKNKDPDWTAGAKVAVETRSDGGKRVWIADVRRTRRGPAGVQEFIKATAEEDGKGVAIWIEEEPGSSGKNNTHHYVTNVLYGYDVHGNRKTGDKISSWRPLAAQAEARNVYLLRGPWTQWWLAEAEASPQPGVHDDGLDAVAGGLEKSSTGFFWY